MEAVEKVQTLAQRMSGSVREGKLRLATAERRERAVVGDAAQGDDGANVGEGCDARAQEAVSRGDLGRCRLVLRRHATH
jgi:hypothetical protein